MMCPFKLKIAKSLIFKADDLFGGRPQVSYYARRWFIKVCFIEDVLL